jgi:hypothetical protein
MKHFVPRKSYFLGNKKTAIPKVLKTKKLTHENQTALPGTAAN